MLGNLITVLICLSVLLFQKFLEDENVLKVGVGTLEDSDYLHQDYNIEVSTPIISSDFVTRLKPLLISCFAYGKACVCINFHAPFFQDVSYMVSCFNHYQFMAYYSILKYRFTRKYENYMRHCEPFIATNEVIENSKLIYLFM